MSLSKRHLDMVKMRDEGATLTAIGRKYGIKWPRVKYILEVTVPRKLKNAA